jgi:hypothetical protein
MLGTILGRNDFVVIVRRGRVRERLHPSGGWDPVAVADRREVADAIAALLREEGIGTEARVVSSHELLHEMRAEDREKILDRLNSRTTAEVRRDRELRRVAVARLTGSPERRSGLDRRSGRDRRGPGPSRPSGDERRVRERRSGRDRRRVPAAVSKG